MIDKLNKQTRARKEFAFADALAKEANGFANLARKQSVIFKDQKDRLNNWKNIMSTAPLLAFTIVFVIVAIGEYLISKEIYREFNSQAPWAIAIVFLIGGIFISDLLVYKLFSQKRKWKRYELRRDTNNDSKTDDEISTQIHKISNRNFFLGLFLGTLFIAAIAGLSYQRAGAELAAGMRDSSFGIMDIMPILLYVIELIAGVFIVYVIKQVILNLKVNTYEKRFNEAVEKCANKTAAAVDKYHDAEKEDYDPVILNNSDNLQTVFHRNNSFTIDNKEKYISEPQKMNDVFNIKLSDKNGNPLRKHVTIITSYKLSSSGVTNKEGMLSLEVIKTYPDDSCRYIFIKDSSNSEEYKKITGDYDLDTHKTHEIILE